MATAPSRPSELLDAAVAAHPQSPAWWWVNRDRVVTFEAARELTADAASGLDAAGVAADARIAIVAHNGLDYLVALFASWWAGARPFLVPIREGVDVGPALDAASPDFTVYTHDRDTEVAASLPPGAVRYCMDGAMSGSRAWAEVLETRGAPAPARDANAEVACWDWDSGTFDRFAFDDLLAGATAAVAQADLGPVDRCFGPLPLADPHQLVAGVIAPLVRHAAACVYGRWEPVAGWEALDAISGTVLIANDTVLREVDAESARRGREPGELRTVLLPEGSLGVRALPRQRATEPRP